MKSTEFNFGHNVDMPADQAEASGCVAVAGGDCFGLLVCPHCGKSVMCSDVATNSIGDNDNMITRPTNRDNGGNNRQSKQRNGLPFLSTREANSSRQPGRIVLARVEDDTFKPGHDVVAMRIEFKGQHFLYNLRQNNPVLSDLCDAFGNDEAAWANKRVEIFNEEDTFNGKLWLRIEPANEQSSDAEPTKTTKRTR